MFMDLFQVYNKLCNQNHVILTLSMFLQADIVSFFLNNMHVHLLSIFYFLSEDLLFS